MKKETIGFSPTKEQNFLERLPDEIRRVNLDQELKTQLAEDFGMVEFTLKYEFDEDGNIVDIKSKEKVMEVMIRGGIDEETESFRKIEQGLRDNSEKVWIHFSPKNKNEKLNYPENCVDFWRVVDGEIVWNRMVVKNDFDSMNDLRNFLSGEEKVENEMEILSRPIAIGNLKLTEIFDLFKLKESGNITDFKEIEEVVNEYLNDFSDDFGDRLTNDSKLIFRLYSACYKKIKFGNISLRDYMYGVMREFRMEESFGCAVTTTIGTFGEKIGYFIADGKVSYGEIPSGFKECKKCGCWYAGDKCPFC
ncbi:MAG: hypothetical protein PHP97_03070 [Candidatus Shapirobacteria bacterium]|nr:hypothetical protein [Candidatus Shapirobacteria bacterium]MDD3002615.1 hypothetical protein [Candidatus Shapirobacteria bacterium]